MDRNRKAQAHIHTRGIVFNRLVNEALHAGKINNGVKFRVNLFRAHTQNGAVKVNIFTPRQLRVETRTNLQHGGHTTGCINRASVGGKNLGNTFKQGGFT